MSIVNYQKYKVAINHDSQKSHGLSVGDIVRRQYKDVKGVIYTSMIVLDVGVDTIDVKGEQKKSHYFIGALIDGDEPKNGELLGFVRTGSINDISRAGALYLTASDTDAPYMDVIDGVGIENSLCYPTALAEETDDKKSKTSYVVVGDGIKSEYTRQDNDRSRMVSVVRESTKSTGDVLLNQFIGNSFKKGQGIIVSYKVRSDKNGSIQLSIQDGVSMKLSDEKIDTDSTARYHVHMILVDNDIEKELFLKVRLNDAIKELTSRVQISELNVILLSDVLNFSDSVKARVGKLNGVSDSVFGTLSSYGAYFQNLYATKNVNISGTLTAGDENGSGSTFYVGKIHKNAWVNSMSPFFYSENHKEVGEICPSGVGNTYEVTEENLIIAQDQSWGEKHREETLCISFWIKSDIISDVMVFGSMSNASTEIPSTNGEWKRVHVPFKVGDMSDTNAIGIALLCYGKSLFSSPQLEVGDSPSLYQPTDQIVNETDDYGAWFSKGGIGGTIQNPLLKLGDDGSISSRTDSFRINTDGSGHLGDKNIVWDKNGNVTFSEQVALSWKKDIDEKLKDIDVDIPEDLSKKLTHIDANGIYTGTLTAQQVNAVSIDAGSIKTGLLDANRIKAGSIKSEKLDAQSIQANIINTGYIQGLNLNFTQGTIGGISITGGTLDTPSMTIHKQGAITHKQGKWALNSDGSGQLASNNIKWDANGNVIFSDNVSLLWKNDFNNAISNHSFSERNLSVGFYKWTRHNASVSSITNESIVFSRSDAKSEGAVSSPTIKRRGDYFVSVHVKSKGESYIYIDGRGSLISVSHPNLFKPPYFFNIPSGFDETIYVKCHSQDEINNTWYVGISEESESNEIELSYPQLTMNSKIVPWSQFPEDLVSVLTKIDSNGIYTGTLNANQINAGTISADRIAVNSIHGDKITANTLHGNRIKADTINGNAIVTNTLHGDKITANTLHGDRVKADTLHGNTIITNTLHANRIQAGTITSDKLNVGDIQAKVVTAGHIQGMSLSFTRGQISSWSIQNQQMYSGNPQLSIGIASTNINAGGANHFYIGDRRLMGTSLLWNKGNNAGHLVFGQVTKNTKEIDDGWFGIQMMNHMGHEFFRLSAKTDLDGSSQTNNKIAGWSFNEHTIQKNSVTLGSDGTINNNGKWQLNNNGSGYLANQNIKWDANGNVTFSDKVKLEWKNDVKEAVGDIKVGGTNLIRNSNFTQGIDHWVRTTSFVIVDDAVFGKCCKLNAFEDAKGVFTKTTRKGAGMYSWSVWAKADAPMKMKIAHEDGTGSIVVDLTTDWQLFSGSGIWNGKRGAFCLYSYGVGNQFYVTNVMYTSGNISTDWSPAPEDFETSISSINGQLKLKASMGDIASSFDIKAGKVIIASKEIQMDGDTIMGALDAKSLHIGDSATNSELIVGGKNSADLFYARGGSLKSEYLEINSKQNSIKIKSNAFETWNGRKSSASTTEISKSVGGVKVEGSTNTVYTKNYFNVDGLYVSAAGTDTGTGGNAKASIVGRGVADLENMAGAFVAGVYGTANNTGSAPAFGGVFDRLKANGLYFSLRKVYINTTLTKQDTYVCCYNSNEINLHLPPSPDEGMMIFIRKMNPKGIRIYGNGKKIHVDGGTVNDMWHKNVIGDTSVLVFDGDMWMFNYWAR